MSTNTPLKTNLYHKNESGHGQPYLGTGHHFLMFLDNPLYCTIYLGDPRYHHGYHTTGLAQPC
jgi:hypothetical protein